MIAQLCRMLGATVIGTVSTREKAKIAQEHGIEHVIVYTEQSIRDEVMRITGGQGCRVAYDGVGKAMFETTLSVLARRGLFVSFGSASGHLESIDAKVFTRHCISFMRPALFEYTQTQQELEALAGFVFKQVQKGVLKPTIHKIYPLQEAPQAQDDIASGRSVGKLLLKI
jgi:NADPH2:quinone reductase